MSANRSTIQIGDLLDALIEQEQVRDGRGLTEYIESTVSPGAALSARQISRIRDISADFPEGDAILALARVISNIGVLDPNTISNRVLWRGQDIWYDQDNLIKEQKKDEISGQSVTIASGWQQPIGLTDDEVVRSIANNIDKGFTYNFVYPDSSTCSNPEGAESKIEGWIDDLRGKVSGVWYAKMVNQKIDRREAALKLNEFNEKLDKKITFKQTISATEFWLLQPSNYCVLYNLGLSKRDIKYRYGSFLIKGQLIREHPRFDSVTSSGWLHLSKDQYQKIEKSYMKAVPDWKGLISESFRSDI